MQNNLLILCLFLILMGCSSNDELDQSDYKNVFEDNNIFPLTKESGRSNSKIDQAKNLKNIFNAQSYNIKNPFFDYMRENTISLINLESLNDFNQKTKCNIDLERFRANIYIDGLEPFEEFKWIGKKIIISKKEFEVFASIPRCKATHYPYKSTIADVNVPYLLQQNYGHINMGIYLRPTSSVSISLDSSIIGIHVR